MQVGDQQTMFSSRARGGSDSWYTPPWIFACLRRIRDICWFDPFPQGWSGRRDGFTQRWLGKFVYVNPPYSKLRLAVRKGLEEVQDRPDQLQVWLIPSRTETQAFQHLLGHLMISGTWPVFFLSRRVQFVGPFAGGENAPFPSALLCVAGRFVPEKYRQRFLKAFGPYGRALIVTD